MWESTHRDQKRRQLCRSWITGSCELFNMSISDCLQEQYALTPSSLQPLPFVFKMVSGSPGWPWIHHVAEDLDPETSDVLNKHSVNKLSYNLIQPYFLKSVKWKNLQTAVLGDCKYFRDMPGTLHDCFSVRYHSLYVWTPTRKSAMWVVSRAWAVVSGCPGLAAPVQGRC